MAMMIDLYPPTSGDAFVGGVSVCHEAQMVQQNLGVCGQQECVHDLLSVEEHLGPGEAYLFGPPSLSVRSHARVVGGAVGLWRDADLAQQSVIVRRQKYRTG